MRILITGGAGFIGSHLAEHFHRRAAVRVLDDLRTGHRSNLAGLDIEFVDGSILDRMILSKVMQDVDYVFHLAAFVSAPQSVLEPHTCVKLNVTGLLNVLEAAATAGVRKLCFSSSAAVYGDSAIVPKREDMCPEPRSLELAQRILSLTGSRSSIQFEPARLGDVHHSRASVERLQKAGFRPTGTLDAGLREMLSVFPSDRGARLVEASPPSRELLIREPAPRSQ
jgi:nucleoside-diphosphate-sugar epimerase